MNEATQFALAATMVRDRMRKLPLADGCDHEMHQLGIIDARIDRQCVKCGGVEGAYANGVRA